MNTIGPIISKIADAFNCSYYDEIISLIERKITDEEIDIKLSCLHQDIEKLKSIINNIAERPMSVSIKDVLKNNLSLK